MLNEKGGVGGSIDSGGSAPGRVTVFSCETRAPNLCCIIATLLLVVLLHLVPGHKKRAILMISPFPIISYKGDYEAKPNLSSK